MHNTNRNTSSNFTFDLNEEASIQEDEVLNPCATLVDYYEPSWSEEEGYYNRNGEEMQCNTDVQEFFADDMQIEQYEISQEQYSDLEEEFPIADDPYILNSRLLQRPIEEATDQHEFL